jgi:hypothetical protein
MKLELLTNATVVHDAIRFVSDKSRDKERLKSSSQSDKEESNESDYYDEDKDQLEEEQKQQDEESVNGNGAGRQSVFWVTWLQQQIGLGGHQKKSKQ